MLEDDALVAALARAPTISINSKLVRRVFLSDLLQHAPMQFLLTSGKPNRFNLAGTACLYLSEDEPTAREEFLRPLVGQEKDAPVVTFTASVKLGTVLDLTDAATCQALELSDVELFAPWRTASRPTATQRLGAAVADRSKIAAIRFPSAATHAAGVAGKNITILRGNVRALDFVHAYGEKGTIVERWPG